jgi:hypothetical protein
MRGFGCIRYTKRAANPVFTSNNYPMIPRSFAGFFSPVLTSLALSLALRTAFSAPQQGFDPVFDQY